MLSLLGAGGLVTIITFLLPTLEFCKDALQLANLALIRSPRPRRSIWDGRHGPRNGRHHAPWRGHWRWRWKVASGWRKGVLGRLLYPSRGSFAPLQAVGGAVDCG